MALNALFTGASALLANSSALDVVGNNLANVNTTGFKGQRVQFKDFVYQTISTGTGATATTGGTNPIQMGFGTGVGAIDTSFNQGSLNPTGRSLDVGIQGGGFFVLSDTANTSYSRAGNFDVDSTGFLIDPTSGFRVQRFGTVGEGDATTPAFQTPGDLNIRVPFGIGVQGAPTANVNYQGNLSTALAIGQAATTSIQINDTQSNSRSLTVQFTKTAANTYSISGTINGGTVTVPPGNVTFDGNGLLTGPSAVTLTLNGLPGPQTVTLNLGTPGQANGLTQFGGVSTVAAVTQDGRGSGTLTSVNFDQTGTLQGIFSNGRTLPIAQLAIATFNNNGGLARDGNNFFTTTAASGEALVGVAGAGGRGNIQGSALEQGNVDIAIEFSRLIIAQRGFQVNARTITVSSDVLQELANIVR